MEEREIYAVTEDEAALYDRQIRLWGLDAQNRIRKAHIVVINLDGLTTEAIKNWVLAGISTLTVADTRESTEWNDLSAGFLWRENDVGGKRLPPAAARIQALNPLVKINILSPVESRELLDQSSTKLANLGANVVVVGVPSGVAGLSKQWGRASLELINDQCRRLSIFFYCAGTLGLNGWIFSDLGPSHDYVIERPELKAPKPASTNKLNNGTSLTIHEEQKSTVTTNTSAKKLEKRRQSFVSLRDAQSMTWKDLTRAQKRKNKPSPGLLGVWAIWDLIEDKSEKDTVTATEIIKKVDKLIQDRDIEEKMIFNTQNIDKETYFTNLEMSIKEKGEFSPTCAILGGVLSQDVLNALGGREEPLVNWFQLEGLTGSGPIHALGTSASITLSS